MKAPTAPGSLPTRVSKGTPPQAHNVEVYLKDVLDGEPAEDTITFRLDGRDYDIDLSTTNAEELRELLRPLADTGRETTRSSSGRGTRSRASDSDLDPAKIQARTKENGYEVSDRGRIHQTATDAYCTAH